LFIATGALTIHRTNVVITALESSLEHMRNSNNQNCFFSIIWNIAQSSSAAKQVFSFYKNLLISDWNQNSVSLSSDIFSTSLVTALSGMNSQFGNKQELKH